MIFFRLLLYGGKILIYTKHIADFLLVYQIKQNNKNRVVHEFHHKFSEQRTTSIEIV